MLILRKPRKEKGHFVKGKSRKLYRRMSTSKNVRIYSSILRLLYTSNKTNIKYVNIKISCDACSLRLNRTLSRQASFRDHIHATVKVKKERRGRKKKEEKEGKKKKKKKR